MLKENEIVIDMLKTLKETQPKLQGMIEDNIDEEDITNCCLVVNEDLQKTMERFRAIKEER